MLFLINVCDCHSGIINVFVIALVKRSGKYILQHSYPFVIHEYQCKLLIPYWMYYSECINTEINKLIKQKIEMTQSLN